MSEFARSLENPPFGVLSSKLGATTEEAAMDGISIRYRYGGDETAWRAAVDAFIDAINSDPDVSGKFSYAVSVARDGETRSHTGRWDTEATLKTLQSRDYFKTFAQTLKEMAGDSLDAAQISLYRETR